VAGVIRISDPARLGLVLGTLRLTNGWGRREMARHLAQTHGTEATNNLNLWSWDTGRRHPSLESLPGYLEALAVDLALIPREDTP
jgi:hypothetical protein